MTETTKAIQEFATKVRAALTGLSTEEIQDLTDGLEADLAERAADHGTNFGSAAAYAAELKAAAGLTAGQTLDTGSQSKPVALPQLKNYFINRLAASNQKMSERIDRTPALRALVDWLKPLAPALWLARAYLVYFFFAYDGLVTEFGRSGRSAGYLPDGPVTLTLLLVLIAISVQLGRKKSAKTLRLLVKGVFTVWALLMIPAFANSFSWASYTSNVQVEFRTPTEGLYSAGTEVTNVFAYDSNGNPLKDVQLFDQDGKPLAVGNNLKNDNGIWYHSVTNSVATIPHTQSPWITGWNVFPLQQVSMDSLYSGQQPMPNDAPLPFGKANPLVLSQAPTAPSGSVATVAPTASATTTPTRTPSPSPKPSK